MSSPNPLRIAVTAAALAVAFATAARAHGPASAHVAELTRSLAAHPGDAALWLERAEFLHADGRLAEALADLDHAAALDSRLARVAFVRGRVRLDAGDAAGAALALERYAALEPADGEGWSLLARAHAALGRDRAVVLALDRAVAALERPSPDHYLDRARALERLGPAYRGRAVEGLREGLARIGAAPALVAELARWPGAEPAASWPVTTTSRVHRAPATVAGASPSGFRSGTQSVALTRGPYLQSATQTGVTIRWRTASPTDSRVRWGNAPGNLTNVLDDPIFTAEHEMTIGPLPPGTQTWYSVGSFSETMAGDATTFFWTLPDPAFQGPTRLWVIGDSGLPGAAQNAVRDGYLSWSGGARTHVWLMLGDNAYNTGTDAEYQSGLFTPYAALLKNQCLWPTRGNHDLVRSGADNDYYDLFTLPSQGQSGGVVSGTEAYYAVDYGNLHLVCLDSEGTSLALAGAMRSWLRADLAANNTRPWVIAFWHHPPYTRGSHDSDNPSDSNGKMRDMRQNFLPLLDSLGVDLVLSGHSHSYERSMLVRGHYGLSSTLQSSMKVDSGDGRSSGDGAYRKSSLVPSPQEGAVYSVVGSSAQISGGTLDHPVMISSMNLLGSMAIDVSGNRLDARFIDSAGAALDSFSIVKSFNVGVGPPPSRAATLELAAPRPNPARGAVRFDFTLPRAATVGLAVIAADGRRVATLASGFRDAGPHAAEWDGRDARGRVAPPGVYFGVLEAGGETQVRRFARVR